MALRIDYLAKETGNNLVRNPTLTVATVLTVAVSLALLGASLLIQRGVDHFNTRYKDDVEFIVWMTADAPQENVDAVKAFLDDSLVVRSSNYVNHDATFAEFQTYYADQPEVLDLVDPNDLPTSFRVVPEVPDLALIRSLGQEIEALPGVSQVSYAEEYIKQLNDLTAKVSQIMIGAGLVLAVVSGLLMYNTIRTGLFARRREIEVMRLVGATKWFIRIPFMLEGLVQGVLGAVFAGLAVFVLNKLISRAVAGHHTLKLFESFALSNGSVLTVILELAVVGAALGAVGAGIAVTRYLDA